MLASISCCAASHSSLLSIGASTVPPDTNPDDMAVYWRLLDGCSGVNAYLDEAEKRSCLIT